MPKQAKRRPPMTVAECIEMASRPLTEVEPATRALGIGVNAGYELIARGEFPVRVLRLGHRIKIPTADLLAYLGITSACIAGDQAVTDGSAGLMASGLASVHPIPNRREA